MTMMFASARLPNPKPQVTFNADHPFIVAIIAHSDAVLFLGRLLNP